MCDKYEQKQCKRTGRHRRRSHSCDRPRPCDRPEPCDGPRPCKIPPKCAAIQAGGLSVTTPSTTTTTVQSNDIIPFANTVNLSSCNASIKLVNGVFQIEECGVYSISYGIRLELINPFTLGAYRVELQLAESQMGICPAPVGECWFQQWQPAGNNQPVLYSDGIPDFSGLIRQTVLVKVQNRCAQIALVNKYTGTIVLNSASATLCISKVASCECN